MKRKRERLLLCVVTLLAPLCMQAKEIKGVVLDHLTREPLIGAAVTVKGNSNMGTSTGVSGEFSINMPDGKEYLEVYYVGYKGRDVYALSATGAITIELAEDALGVEEVVVTGQGAAIQKRRISSNVVSVGEDQLAKLPSARIDQMLQTALPNVQINMTSGQPGTTSMIKSRGLSSAFTNGTPVIYVDGVRVDNLNTGASLSSGSSQQASSGSIGDIPLENIEKVEYVSGGAATTLYGSDAANGVIQIFTKKGGQGRVNVFAEAQVGVDMATSRFYYFDRTKELLHQNGLIQKYKLGFDGGKDDFGYSFAASMSNSTGTLIHNKNADKKYDLNSGMKVKLGKVVEYQNSFGVVSQKYGRSRNGNQGGYTGLWFTEGGASSNFGYDPNLDQLDQTTFSQMKTFVSRAEELQNATVEVKRFQTAHSALIKPMNNLTFKATLGMDYRASTDKTITTNQYLIHTKVKPDGTSDAGSIANYDRNYFGLTADVNGQYRAQVGENLSFITTIGYQFFSTNDHQVAYTATNVRDGALTVSGAGVTKSDERLQYLYNYGTFVQENIGIRNKLFVDLGLRYDYNTAFGDNVGWQYYPKVGLSYSMIEEPFMQGLSNKGIVTNLKLRANYGIAGSYPPPFEYQKTIRFDPFLEGQAASFGKYGNPDLAPEKKHSYEIGLDATLWKNKLSVGFTYYYALTKGALFNVPASPSTGYDTYLANVGEIENKGVELFARLNVIKSKDWEVNLSAAYNTNANQVLSTGGAAPFSIGGMSARTIQNMVEESKPVGFLRGYKTILNADGSKKETLELQDLGNTIPTSYGNFSVDVAYKNLSLFISGDYQAGAYVHSFDRQFRFSKNMKDSAIPDRALEGTTQAKEVWNFTNFFVEKSDYVKIRTIGATYRLRFKHVVRFATFSLNVNNPFVFTKASVDPEAVLSGAKTQGAVAVGGLNYSTYSTPCQVIGTVRLTF